MALELSVAEYERLRAHVGGFGPDVELELRERDPEFDRIGSEFAIAEPTAAHEIELGPHNPGRPFDVPGNADIDPELHAGLDDAYALALEGELR
jgi:hypothetical protein